MCGISGLFGPDGNDASIARKMTSLISHRGPDGVNTWAEETKYGGIGFGHSRLSIVDLDGSNQPLFSDYRTVLIQNGEIYNHKEIRSEERIFPFRTKGDGESILAAYHSRKSENDWVQRLDGIWAFALWDSIAEVLILCRDPLGVKPLVRTVTSDGTLLFGSEVKSLRGHPSHVPSLDENALVARIAFEYPLDDTTLFEGVHSVRPGTIETWKLSPSGAELISTSCYNSEIIQPTSSWNPSSAPALLESLTTSIADRLMSDVPLGIVLSGGLDSAMVAALAHEASQRTGYPLPACWTVAESETNPDWLAAENVCSSLDLTHHQYILDEDAFEKSLPSLSWYGEDLDVTVLFFQPLFSKMSESVRVGLCGQGADELHAGYSRYRDLSEHRNAITSRLLSSDHPFATKLLSQPIDEEGWTNENHNPDYAFRDLPKTLQYELNHGQLSNFQLRLVDRHSMAHGLEVRVPFLGKSHREASHQLPMDWKISSKVEKVALREAAKMTKLPESIVNRPKLPAGRATSPTMIDNLLNELSGHTIEYTKDYPSLSRMFKGQEEIALGLRLFRSLHLVDRGIGRYGKDLITLLEDVD
ncbi:MAG: asparagine synthase (glutamine-hydrolyzing) [Candidatus Thalassarchaeaceae archaeon]|nr:asparagine synthase (glutamine-hydrolyzing) [Candidatus Thalassarchaeaceae archaeon]